MKLQIFDVSHGFCAYLTADNNNVMLFDCGHNEETGFRPSKFLRYSGCTGIQLFFITNYDHDHVSDLAELRKVIPIGILHRNRTISHGQLRALKEEGGTLTNALESVLDMVSTYVADVTEPPEFPSIQYEVFHNSYPQFEDTNNLSLVVFVYYDRLGIVFAGDMEKAGWIELIKNPSFRSHLARMNIFVASHHGRESGYCSEVFNFCRPDIILISDKSIVHETQNVNYAKHANGLSWNGTNEKRYVLTTRNDGSITIDKNIGEGYRVTIST